MAQRGAGAVDEELAAARPRSSRPAGTTTSGTGSARITCPTFVAAGRFDGIAPLANSEAIASRVPGATLHVYEGGHAFFAQDPRALPEVIDFLAS